MNESSEGKGRGDRAGARQGRRARVDPGRWLLERQRFGLPPNVRPRPPDRMVPIRSLIPRLMERIQESTHLHVEEIQRIWPETAGPSIAGHARPGALEKGTLIVFVDHSMWLSEIQRNHARTLLQRLQAAYPQGSIRRLAFRLDPDNTMGRRKKNNA